jgi:anhydro-N-acetylmuramic acid kinase
MLHQGHELGLAAADVLATAAELTARSIADAYARWAPGPVGEVCRRSARAVGCLADPRQVLVSGGGAHNKHLMRRLVALLQTSTRTAGASCGPLTALGVTGDAKEALMMALLAYLCVRGRPGNVPSCTGARTPIVLGKIVPGRNFSVVMSAAAKSE